MRRVMMAAALFQGATATAQQAVQTRRTFTPSDFERFAPQTALDMVRQIPGFEIEREDNNRGFGQASGNVLINSRRLSGKSNDAVDALGRIPADNVVEIRLVDGATLEIPGLSGQVVDVITNGSKFSGAWEWQGRLRERLEPNFETFEASITGNTGQFEWTLGIENRPNRSGNAGPEILTDGFGVVIEERDEDQRFNSDFTEATAALTWNRPNGDIGNFNGSFALFNFHTREASFRFPVDGVDNQRIFRRGEDEWNSEVSGDYQFGLGPGKLKLIGLYRAENSEFASETLEAFEDARPLDISRFNQDVFESEVIARAEYDISPKQGRDWQFSIEAARNVLDADSSFFLLDSNGVFVEELLDNADTRVEERRAETNVTYSRRLTPKLSLQSSIGVEYSELSQSGPTGQTRDFFRPKGFISAAWQGSPRFAVTARVEREVGQLNFFDFVSSVNLNIENEDEGNPDLVPSQTWAGEIEFERNFGDAGAATLRLYGDLISDLNDLVPIGEDGVGVGNLDNAQRYGAEINTTLNLDGLGLTGVQLEIEAEARETSVEDPFTGLDRRISGNLVSFVFAEARWDIPKTDFAVSLGYDQFRGARRARRDELLFGRGTPGFGFLFIEHKDLFGATGFFELGNLFNQQDRFTRDVFEPDRTGPLVLTEDRKRDFGLIYTVGISGSF